MKVEKISILIFVFALAFCSKGHTKNPKTTFKGSLEVVPARALKVEKGKIFERYSFLGVVVPQKQIILSPEISGKVKRILVEEGQKVKKGQVLLELDTSSLQLELERIKTVEKSLEVKLNLMEREFERAKKLFEKKAISEAEFEKIRTNFETLKLELSQIKIQKENILLKISKAKIRSPEDGEVKRIFVEKGEVVFPQTPLILLSSQKSYFEALFPQKDNLLVHEGHKVFVIFPTLGKRIEGKVESVFATEDGSVKLKVELSEKIPQGIAGRVEFEVEEGEGILLPPEALWIDTDGTWLFAISKTSDGYIAKKVKVKVRKILSKGVWIDGFPAWATAVVSPATDKLYDKAKLKIISWITNNKL